MNHLTVDEIIEFVSSHNLDDEGINLIRKVNEHIRKCTECYEKVRAFQLLYDEFASLCLSEDFESYIYNSLKDNGIDLQM